MEETLRLRKAKLGSEHPDTVGSMGNLGAAVMAQAYNGLAVKSEAERGAPTLTLGWLHQKCMLKIVRQMLSRLHEPLRSGSLMCKPVSIIR